QPGTSGSTAAASPTAPATTSSSGNTPAVASPTSSPSTPSRAAAGPAACPTSSLQVKLGVAQGYAGGVYVAIDSTSTSGSACPRSGSPGVSLVPGPPYTQIGLAAKRSASTPKTLVTLAPGATGHAVLQIVDALNYPSSSCGPVKATALK